MQKAIVEELFSLANSLPYNGSGMAEVPKMKGSGFFPGCIGLSTGFTDDHRRQVMVLGQDFGTQTYYNELDEAAGEMNTSRTFRQLAVLLDDIGLKKEDCFFTNIFPGLRNSGRMTGPCQPARIPENPFADACREFLKMQIEAVMPKLVIVLGTHPAKTLAEWWPRNFIGWKNLQGVTNPISTNRFYDYDGNLFHDVPFAHGEVRFLFALHPSMSNTHRGLIWGRGGGGRERETELLKRALP